MAYDVNGTSVEHDEEGYITNLGDWTKDLAEVIAKAEPVELPRVTGAALAPG